LKYIQSENLMKSVIVAGFALAALATSAFAGGYGMKPAKNNTAVVNLGASNLSVVSNTQTQLGLNGALSGPALGLQGSNSGASALGLFLSPASAISTSAPSQSVGSGAATATQTQSIAPVTTSVMQGNSQGVVINQQ
jgi:hypothetical protein